MKNNILNLLLFQIGWLVCITSGNYAALGYTVLVLVFHWRLFSPDKREWWLILLVTVVGVSWDWTMSGFGILVFSEAVKSMLPLWLVCVWILFATTYQHGMYWLQGRPVLAALLAAVMGPVSYWSGSQLNEVALGEPLTLSLIILAIGWGTLFPVSMQLAKRMVK
ncbi:MAG: hypothetical protein ACI9LO_001875 [Planctomycetota bacterium]|jgi:hypothetical protein